MFLYAWLHLAGYALPLEELQRFRQAHSLTPGHPECVAHAADGTPGVEATTGPLGTGIGNAVGMALAAKAAAAKYNTREHSIFNHSIIALCGDGCLQEGIAYEALSFAAHEKLNNLILLYDANEITLDNRASFTQSENHILRMQALGWNTLEVSNGHDLQAIDEALLEAKRLLHNGKPTFVMIRTVIGKGIKAVEGLTAAHGEAGLKYAAQAREDIGLPSSIRFYVSPETKKFFQERKNVLHREYLTWMQQFSDWKRANPALAVELSKASTQPETADLFSHIPAYDTKVANVATRQSAADILQYIARLIPNYLSGAADLHSSTKNYISSGGNFGNPEIIGKDGYGGRNIHFGIREHAMGAIMNGIAYYGLHSVSGATFLAFADYLRPAIRIAALSKLRVTYLFTHDSVGVGEDGPTHQPVESLSSLRLIPHLDVIRPADAEEVTGAFAASLKYAGPTAIILTRQGVPHLSQIPVALRREGVMRGAYIARQEKDPSQLSHILFATGSELQLAITAAEELGDNVRVVSMPCMERFERQSPEYKAEILAMNCPKRLAIEAGVTGLWYKYVGSQGKVIGVDDFGFSAPGEVVMQSFGLTKANIVATASSM